MRRNLLSAYDVWDAFVSLWYILQTRMLAVKNDDMQWRIQGRGGSPLFLDQTEARRQFPSIRASTFTNV